MAMMLSGEVAGKRGNTMNDSVDWISEMFVPVPASNLGASGLDVVICYRDEVKFVLLHVGMRGYG
jgi:hypothetical protein